MDSRPRDSELQPRKPVTEEKIVRDGYADKPNIVRRATGDDRRDLLLEKLYEEVDEAFEAADGHDKAAFRRELADIVEVCFALGGYKQVEAARFLKRAAVGRFRLGLVMRIEH